MPSPDPLADTYVNQPSTNGLSVAAAEFTAQEIHGQGWFVQSRTIDEMVLSDWADLHSCHDELPFYLHPDWIRCCNQSLFEDTLSMVTVFRTAIDVDDAVTDAVQTSNVSKVANSNDWLPSVMFAVTDNGDSSLAGPAHDHLTLGDLLIHPSLSAAEIISALAAVQRSGIGKSLEFGNLPDSSMLMRSVFETESSGQDSNLWVRRSVRETAWFELDTDTSVPSGKLRRNLNRLERKLKEKGCVEYRFTSGDNVDEAYQRFLQVEASGWKGSTGTETAILGSQQLQEFYGSLLKPVHANLLPSINELFVDDELVASQFSLRTGDNWYILKIAYDESFADYSPGSLLLHAMVLNAKEAGIKRLSLVTNPPWAERWHPSTETVWRLIRHGSSFAAMKAKALNEIKNKIRQGIG